MNQTISLFDLFTVAFLTIIKHCPADGPALAQRLADTIIGSLVEVKTSEGEPMLVSGLELVQGILFPQGIDVACYKLQDKLADGMNPELPLM